MTLKQWIMTGITLVLGILGYILLITNFINGSLSTGCFVTAAVLFLPVLVFFRLRFRWGRPLLRIKGKPANILCFFIVTFLIICMEEITWNPEVKTIYPATFLIDYLIVALLTACLIGIFRRTLAVYFSVALFNFLYGLANFYVYSFKGCPPTIGDILAAGTAAKVMSNYAYAINDGVVIGGLIFVILMTALLYFTPSDIVLPGTTKKRLLISLGALLVSVGLFAGVFSINYETFFKKKFDNWQPANSYKDNGAPVTLIATIRRMKVTKPAGYSAAKIKALLDTYPTRRNSMTETPTIIVVMNEAFSDLSVLGDFQSEEYLPFLRNTNDYVMKGYAYSSVYGAGTCDSEFEFLTGASMAFFTRGLYPYRSCDLSNTSGISRTLRSAGYDTVAYHPNAKQNWNRDKAYTDLKFNTFYCIHDMDGYGSIRGFVSDASDYEFVKSIYDARTDDKLFIFNVTMQNHGGYLGDISSEVDVIKMEEKYAGYEDVVNYLSLVRVSDAALRDMIEVYSAEDAPVVICFFGDHQPSLDQAFLDDVMEGNEYSNDIEKNEQRFIVPYLIWSNYDLGIEKTEKDLSLNYLGANLLDAVGIRTRFTSYLLDLEQYIPVITSGGYQTADGVWHSHDEANALVKQYEAVQYYELFEKGTKE